MVSQTDYDLTMTIIQKQEINNRGVRRPIGPDSILVPKLVTLANGRVLWSFGDGFRTVQAAPGLLLEFADLSQAPKADTVGRIPDPSLDSRVTFEERVLAFAGRWGVLELCRHRLPASHAPEVSGQSVPAAWCTPRRSAGVFCESTVDWRCWANGFRTLLGIAANLGNGGAVSASDWEPVLELPNLVGNDFLRKRGSSELNYEKLSVVLNVLVSDAAIRPCLFRLENGWQIKFSGGTGGCGLFGALVTQLMITSTLTQGVELCSACGRAYFPTRLPNRARRHYCSNCSRESVPLRDAAREYRRRKRQASAES